MTDKTATTDCLVAILWATNVDNAKSVDDLNFHFLAYDGGNGHVRVYHRDQYDPRCDLGHDRAKDGPLPYFGNWQAAERFLLASPDWTLCQVEIRALRRPFPSLDLASVSTDRQCDDVFVYDRNRTCSHCGQHCFEVRVLLAQPEPYRCAFCLTLLPKFRARVAGHAKKV